MIDSTVTPSDRSAAPVVFNATGNGCFGWFHPAREPSRGIGVVLCRPMGYEAICSYQTYTQLAENLSEAGFDCMRFDYDGTGDSAGSDTDAHRVNAWVKSITTAALTLKKLSGVSRLSLFGVRLGATLAAEAALKIDNVTSLVLWAPCVTGRAFVRELRAGSALRSQPEPEEGDATERNIESLGHLYTPQTIRELTTLKCLHPGQAPAERILIIDRDDLPCEKSLAAGYADMGIEVTQTVLPGYAGMMAEPHEGALNHITLDRITNWLSALPTSLVSRLPPTQLAAPGPIELLMDGIRESALRFGPTQSLFGIVTEPTELSSSESTCETGILMLNVGRNHHIGPNRIYVKMARAWAKFGYRALRFDMLGIGESSHDDSGSLTSLYSRDSSEDVHAAVDCLIARGCKKIVTLGICSGAFVAFQAALADPRISGQILMNPRLLEWREDQQISGWQRSMLLPYKSIEFYRRALFKPAVYKRVLRGEVNVKGIAKRFWSVMQARFERGAQQMVKGVPLESSVLEKVKLLSARGTDTLLIMAADDDGRDYIEFHFGVRGSRLRNDTNFRMVVVEDSDHTFSRAKAQQLTISTIQEHLDSRVSNELPARLGASATFKLIKV